MLEGASANMLDSLSRKQHLLLDAEAAEQIVGPWGHKYDLARQRAREQQMERQRQGHSATPSSSRSKLRRGGGARANAESPTPPHFPSGKWAIDAVPPSIPGGGPSTAFLPIAFARGSRCGSCAVPPL